MKSFFAPVCILLAFLPAFNNDVRQQTIISAAHPKSISIVLQDNVAAMPVNIKDTSKKILSGEELYKRNCASCHFPLKDFVGPALAKCREREPDRNWAYWFVTNASMMLETDAYAKALLKKYGSRRPQFNLSKKEVESILDYCDSYRPPKPVH
jgi:cytochrome c2